MIPHLYPVPRGKHAKSAEEIGPSGKHRDNTMGNLKHRDYPDHVCPGRHCAGRLGISPHQLTLLPVHTMLDSGVFR